MARPEPTILLEHVESKTYLAEQILQADALYSVFYKGSPVNIRTLNKLISQPGPRYKKISYSNRAHCERLVERLNKKFHTNDFTVRKFTSADGVDI